MSVILPFKEVIICLTVSCTCGHDEFCKFLASRESTAEYGREIGSKYFSRLLKKYAVYVVVLSPSRVGITVRSFSFFMPLIVAKKY